MKSYPKLKKISTDKRISYVTTIEEFDLVESFLGLADSSPKNIGKTTFERTLKSGERVRRMSGATIDYELRPAKNVDRRVFIDLLARSERYKTLEGATYVSMGGYPMTDHRMVHRRLGIENLVSIDGDSEVVDRQKIQQTH